MRTGFCHLRLPLRQSNTYPKCCTLSKTLLKLISDSFYRRAKGLEHQTLLSRTRTSELRQLPTLSIGSAQFLDFTDIRYSQMWLLGSSSSHQYAATSSSEVQSTRTHSWNLGRCRRQRTRLGATALAKARWTVEKFVVKLEIRSHGTNIFWLRQVWSNWRGPTRGDLNSYKKRQTKRAVIFPLQDKEIVRRTSVKSCLQL